MMAIKTITSVYFLLLLAGFSSDDVDASAVSVGYNPGADAVRWYINVTEPMPWVDRTFYTEDGDPLVAAVMFYQNPRKPRRRFTDEERLMGMLFRNYAGSLRPVYNSSKSVNVKFGISLIQICNMDEVNQVLELSIWLEMQWREERLQWNPHYFSGLKMIRLPTRLLWTPDIVLYNSADDFDRKKAQDVRAMIAHTGDVFLGPYLKVRSTCILDLTLYPYDEQECKLVFGSWTYDSSQLVLKSKTEHVEMSQYIDSAKWELLDTDVTHAQRHHSCCKAPYSDIIITIKMRRRFLYNNLFNIFIPTIWLSLLCLLCFYLAPESGEKITLGITVLLTFTWYTWMIAENTPRTSDFIPLISIYLTVTMTLSALVVGLQVFMLNVHVLAPVLRPVPKWLQICAIDGIARFLRIENVHQDYKNTKKKKRVTSISSKRTNNNSRQSSESSCFGTAADNAVTLQRFASRLGSMLKRGEHSLIPANDEVFLNSQGWPGEVFSDEVLDEQFDNMMDELGSVSRLRFLARESQFYEAVERVVIGSNEDLHRRNLFATRKARSRHPSGAERVENELYDRLINSVTYMAKAEQNEALTERVANEWRLLAIVFDRLAFWFFFIFTTLLTFCLLVLVPLMQKKYPKPQYATNARMLEFEDDHHKMLNEADYYLY